MMTFETFQQRVAEAQAKNPMHFELKRDAPLSVGRVGDIEREHGVELPDAYRRFLCVYGAGDFAFTVIYSPDPTSEWSVWRDVDTYLGRRRDFLPFADNGCGDYYGFPVVAGRCEDRVVWADHEEGYSISKSKYEGFLDYMVKVGLRCGPSGLLE